MSRTRTLLVSASAVTLVLAAGCLPRPLPPLLPTGEVLPTAQGPKPTPPSPRTPPPAEAGRMGPVPYSGALPPGDPVQMHPPQRPLTPSCSGSWTRCTSAPLPWARRPS